MEQQDKQCYKSRAYYIEELLCKLRRKLPAPADPT